MASNKTPPGGPQFEPLPKHFYQPSAAAVAPRLLGQWLVRTTPAGPVGGPIVEVEAYVEGDPACHAYIGRTARNRVMWGEPGRAYVYLIYGFHFCFNAVCQPEGTAEAVLVRAIEPLFGEQFMQSQRSVANRLQLTSGPGKLCSAMDIDRSLDGADLCDPQSPVLIAANPQLDEFLAQRGPVVTTTRIGITLAAHLPLRFLLPRSPFISRPPAGLKQAAAVKRARRRSTRKPSGG